MYIQDNIKRLAIPRVGKRTKKGVIGELKDVKNDVENIQDRNDIIFDGKCDEQSQVERFV